MTRRQIRPSLRRGLALVLALSAPSLGAADDGALAFFVNGEELATEGFVGETLSKDGWEIRFSHVRVTLDNIAAHRTDPPFEAGDGAALDPVATVALEGPLTVDLLSGGADGRVRLGAAAAPEGHYNAISWSLAPAEGGAHPGASMVFEGQATRDGETVDFVLIDPRRHDYRCGEYVGDARKGFVAPGAEADLEMTLHLDHLFGRADLPADDPMNLTAIGFDPFAAGGAHELDLEGLHLGHVGEGHCEVSWN